MTLDLGRLSALATDLRERAGAVARPAASRQSWFSVDHARAVVDETVIGIYDEIGEWGVTARDFVNELNGIKAKKITVQIASNGGAVWDGLAIYAALAGHPAEIATDVVSHAFSAASFIAQAASPGKRRVRKNARMMIHDPAIGGGVVTGNAKQLREFKDRLEEIAVQLDEASTNIASIYAERAGDTSTEAMTRWRALMEAETFFGAEDAVQVGLADEVVSAAGEPTNKATNEPVPTSALAGSDYAELLNSLKGVFQ